jgi:hypothetical protein
MLKQISSLDIFLFEEVEKEIDQEERNEWVKKLLSFDTSPNEEEGVFVTARFFNKKKKN